MRHNDQASLQCMDGLDYPSSLKMYTITGTWLFWFSTSTNIYGTDHTRHLPTTIQLVLRVRFAGQFVCIRYCVLNEMSCCSPNSGWCVHHYHQGVRIRMCICGDKIRLCPLFRYSHPVWSSLVRSIIVPHSFGVYLQHVCYVEGFSTWSRTADASIYIQPNPGLMHTCCVCITNTRHYHAISVNTINHNFSGSLRRFGNPDRALIVMRPLSWSCLRIDHPWGL